MKLIVLSFRFRQIAKLVKESKESTRITLQTLCKM